MLVRSNHGAVHMVQAPVQVILLVCLALKFSRHSVPHACLDPSVEPPRTGLPGSVLLGEIAPRSSGAQDPEDAIDHQTMILGRAAGLRFLWRQCPAQPLPLLVSQYISCHVPYFRRVWKQDLGLWRHVRVPDDLPEVPVRVSEVAGVDTPRTVVRLIGDGRPGCLCSGEQGIDLSPA